MLKERLPFPVFQRNGYTRLQSRLTGRQQTRLKSRVPLSYFRDITLAILIPALMLTCCGKAKVKEGNEAEPPASVQVDDVTRGPIDVIVEADAVLYPINQASVTSKISAPIRRILVNRGDHVKTGQLLAELESRDLASAAQESKSQFEQTQSALQTVTGATVPEDRTKAEADVQSAQQALDAAQEVYDSRVELQKQGALAR